MSVTKLSSLYGGKGLNGNNSLEASEWNSVLGIIDLNFDLVANQSTGSGSTPSTPSSGAQVDKATLLSLLKLTNTTDDVLGADIDEEVITEEASKNADNASNLRTHGTYKTTAPIKNTSDPTANTMYARGAAAEYTLHTLKGYAVDTTTASQLASVNESGVETALGDRVRFGSWYLPKPTLTKFNCSHEFVELVNSGTEDFPLDDVKLGIIYRNSRAVEKEGTKDLWSSKHYSIKEFTLKGSIKKKSSYLIRGTEVADSTLDSTYIKLKNNFDIDLTTLSGKDTFDNQTKAYNTTGQTLTNAVGLLLYNSALSANIVQANTELALLVDTDTTWTYIVDQRLVDVILVDATAATHLKNGPTGSNLYGKNPSYAKTENAIVKDQYSLDPAKQAYRSLTKSSLEASNIRIEKVQTETVPLGKDTISFPHSKPALPVTKYAPKASGQGKNVLTDKTSPDFEKPNMVTCSFGINARTTRCFNWFSMTQADEYVWIRKKGERKWYRFESYKAGDGVDPIESGDKLIAPIDSNTKIHRIEFCKDLINSVYKRMDNTFPGDDTYKYRAHKCIVYIQPEYDFDTPIEYQYIVGLGLDYNGTIIPKDDATSDILTFTIYPGSWTPKVYHTTDQQGFGWMEYQAWAGAAEEINNRIAKECTMETKLFPVLINTGDMTQNGTRVNEWLDYYKGGYSLFKHLEQMNVVGNNDLCNSLSPNVLGNGDDLGKSSPYYFHVFYCYEIPNEVTAFSEDEESNIVVSWKGGLVCNNVYIPSMYYFYFNKYAYLMVNSELTETTCQKYFNQSATIDRVVNLYTGNSRGECAAATNEASITTSKDHYIHKTLESWIDAIRAYNSNAIIIAACHEMPYTVIIRQQLTTDHKSRDRCLNASNALIGSHLNHLGSNWLKDNTYWFSKMLQDKGIKLCIGGHKHTYGITYPVEEAAQAATPESGDFSGIHFSKQSIIYRPTPADRSGGGSVESRLWAYSTNATNNGIVYFMLQATGFKLKSNKELPSVEQYYSHVVPVSTWKANGTEGTPDNSQLYPMYGTYIYKSGEIEGSIYRVINVTKENVDTSTHISAPKDLSETVYGTKPMYSELLIVNTSVDGTSENYWLVPTEHINDCLGCSNGTVNVAQRCIMNADNTITGGYVESTTVEGTTTITFRTKTLTNVEASNCTVKIKL